MTRNYKAGPRRSRRRPDPSTIINAGAVIYPWEIASATPGAGSLALQLILRNPASGSTANAQQFQLTGVPWDIYVTTGSSRNTPDVITWDPGNNRLDLNWSSGLGPVLYTFVMAARQQALRGINGEWVGSASGSYQIT